MVKNNLKLTTLESNFNFIKYFKIINTPIEKLDKFYMEYFENFTIENGNLDTIRNIIRFGKTIKLIKINNNKKLISLNSFVFNNPLITVRLECNCLVNNTFQVLRNVKLDINTNNDTNIIIINGSYYICPELIDTQKLYNISVLKNIRFVSFYLLEHKFNTRNKFKIKSLQDLCSQKLVLMNKENINDTDENGNLTIPQEVKDMYYNLNYSTIKCQNGNCNNSITINKAYIVYSLALIRSLGSNKIMRLYQFNCHKCMISFTKITKNIFN